MFNNAFTRQNRLYSIALIGAGLLSLIALVLLGLVAVQAWQQESAFRTQQSAFERAYAAWQQQDFQSYTVEFTNCSNQFCCQNATMVVEARQRISLEGDCDNNTGAYSAITTSAMTMDELYSWLNDQYSSDYGVDDLLVEYDPEWHYVRRVRWRFWEGDPYSEALYTDFVPRS